MTNNKTKYWLESAEYDLETAEAMLESCRFLYVGFMCHQAIEKGLKALIAISDETPKIHNLVQLAKKAEIFDKLNQNQIFLLNKLNPLNIQARYPEYKKNISESLTFVICNNLLIESKEFFIWIQQQL